jgi:hypothetical protein
MSNRQKAKGTLWETTIVRFLKDQGIPAYRPAQSGTRDVGDVHASPVVIQAKDRQDVMAAIREGLDGVQLQVRNAGETYGVAVVKRARKPAADAYAVLRLEDLAAIIRELRGD